MTSAILNGLFLGGIEEAHNTLHLQKLGVSHILTIDCKPLSLEVSAPFSCKYVHALDMESSDLLSHFEECLRFIDEGREPGGVLVHCLVGQSRSATIVLAYMMQKLDLCLDDALTMVMKQRPTIKPNYGFMEQLKLFESMGNKVDPRDDLYKHFKLNNLAIKMQTAQIVGCLPEGSLSADPSQNPVSGENMYKCKKCRRALFKESSVLRHEKGQGEVAFTWRGKLQHSLEGDDDKAPVCTQSLFIEPVQWMADAIIELEGKVQCPKCRAKLGSFNWAGERCPCGRWLTPAFHVQIAKVDLAKPIILPQPAQHSGATTAFNRGSILLPCFNKPPPAALGDQLVPGQQTDLKETAEVTAQQAKSQDIEGQSRIQPVGIASGPRPKLTLAESPECGSPTLKCDEQLPALD